MRRLCVLLSVGLIIGLLTAGTVLAETAVVTKPWTRVRRSPSEKAGAVVIVYANDTLTVLSSSGGWVKVRTPNKTEGWVAASDIASGVGPSMSSGSRPGTPEGRQAGGRTVRDAGI